MSDTADVGSVETTADASAPAGTPDTTATEAVNGSAAEVESPWSGLQDADTRTWVEKKGYKTPEDVAKAARNAEQKLGSSFSLPEADAPREEWDKVYEKLGRPESADGYEFKRPEGLPENLPYNQELADASKSWMHEAGLSGRQAQVVHDQFAKHMAEQQQAAIEAQSKAVETTFDNLTKEWGPQDGDAFKTKMALADRAAKKLGLLESFKQSGLVLPDGALTDPQLAKALAEVGQTMFAEDTIGNDPLPITSNPFKRDASGNRQVSAISALVKSDPERAKRLAKEAGENPLSWGLR